MTTPAPYPPIDGSQACAQPFVDPDWWFPARPDDTQAKTALMLCRSCPFREPCAAYAYTHAVVGVWGATTDRQRQSRRRQNGVVAVPVVERGRVDPARPLWQQVLAARAEGMGNSEIADLLGIPYGSVVTMVSRYKHGERAS